MHAEAVIRHRQRKATVTIKSGPLIFLQTCTTMSKEYNSSQLASYYDENSKSPMKEMDPLDLSKVQPDLFPRLDMFEYGSGGQPYERISFSGFNDSFGLQNGMNASLNMSNMNNQPGIPNLNNHNDVNNINHNNSVSANSVAPEPRTMRLGSLPMGMNAFVKKEEDDDNEGVLPKLLSSSAPKRDKPRTKSAHNVIEQRYRNKINDKFTTLQNSVPTLRVIARKKSRSRSDDDDEEDEYYYLPPLGREDLEGLEPARKLNKGTILAKSVEYIKFLERKNDRMKLEHQQLVERARMLGIVLDDTTGDDSVLNYERPS